MRHSRDELVEMALQGSAWAQKELEKRLAEEQEATRQLVDRIIKKARQNGWTGPDYRKQWEEWRKNKKRGAAR